MSRVLHVVSGLGTGGAETYLARLAPQLASRGVEQHVVSLSGEGPTADDLHRAGIPLSLIKLRGAPVLAVHALLALKRQIKPDIVQGWMYHGDLLATIAHRFAYSGPCKLYWGVRCSDMDLQRYTRQLRLVVRACTLASRLPDLIIANSDAGMQAHRALGYRAKQWEVIHNGVDLNRFKPDPALRHAVRAELNADSQTVLAFHVARVDPMKGHEVLFEAIKRLASEGNWANVRIVLVGQGTNHLNLPDGVVALGARKDVARLLSGGDIIVSSSVFGEGYPNALAEGMATGLIPVATDVGDSAQLIDGLSRPVPANSAEDLAAALLDAARLVRSERSDLRQQIRARMGSAFSFEASVDTFARLYTSSGSNATMDRT